MDKLILENYLLILKSTVEVYIHGTLESSNKSIRDLLKKSLDQTLESQSDTYDLMCEYGWYCVDDIDKKAIRKSLNNIESM